MDPRLLDPRRSCRGPTDFVTPVVKDAGRLARMLGERSRLRLRQVLERGRGRCPGGRWPSPGTGSGLGLPFEPAMLTLALEAPERPWQRPSCEHADRAARSAAGAAPNPSPLVPDQRDHGSGVIPPAPRASRGAVPG